MDPGSNGLSSRVATTGKKAKPPLFETPVNLGRGLVRRRLRRCIVEVKKPPRA